MAGIEECPFGNSKYVRNGFPRPSRSEDPHDLIGSHGRYRQLNRKYAWNGHISILDTTDNLYFLNTSEKSQFAAPDSEYSTTEIKKSIDELANEYRIPFTMHTEGFKYKEIAEKLDLSIGTVKSRIFFSRKKLMKKLQDF